MKKTIIKISVFILVFIVSLVIISKVMNKGHNNMTMEMQPAGLPVLMMQNSDIPYNQLHGYREVMDVAYQRETITVLGEHRDTRFLIDTYGREITGIAIEVRSTDGSRLIENTPIRDYQITNGRVSGRITVKDLIEPDEEYALIIILELDAGEVVRYYTRIIWSENLYESEKLAFVKDFHERLYDKEAAKEITRYLETNASLEDSRSFHKVNIHSSFQQITWGDLQVKEVIAPAIQLKEIANQTASVVLDYVVSTGSGKDIIYYQVQEYFRLRHTPERMYLLDYQRTMTQISNPEEMYANDKILLGITEETIPLAESADGNVVAFEVANCLYSYNATTNKLTKVFSFYDEENVDVRTLYGQHAIKIIDINEGGNINFAVYGYMNRGRHEGEVGIQVYYFDQALNTIEELVYIPYDKSYSVLASELEELFYLNRQQKLYLSLEGYIFEVDLNEKTYEKLIAVTQDDSVHVSDNHTILVWQPGEDFYGSDTLEVRNLNNDIETVITADRGESLKALGFMGEDIIYGVARKEEIVKENSGQIIFPMYKVCIANALGETLKEYRQDNIYVTDCVVEGNQITLARVRKEDAGKYIQIVSDQIMNTRQEEVGKNRIVTADIDVYKRYVQIQTQHTIDSKTIKILNPKEVVFEGGRELPFEVQEEPFRYYVYGPYGVSDIYYSPAKAINRAYNSAGVVVDGTGSSIWVKGNLVTRNQIMAIKKPEIAEEKSSLAVCLDTILKYEGVMSNTEYLLQQGSTVMDILEENLEDADILDLTGCQLDAVLYYVNRDLPVLALLENGEAVLVTGFNEFNVVIMDPSRGTLEKEGMNDTAKWFGENGNRFITYIKES